MYACACIVAVGCVFSNATNAAHAMELRRLVSQLLSESTEKEMGWSVG